MNFRKFMTTSGKPVLAGKNAEQNEELLRNNLSSNDLIFHTASPGSPFCAIKGKTIRRDKEEVAVFCARYSQEWKKSRIKKDVIVHYFTGRDIYKERTMKKGTFGVKKFRFIKAKKDDIEKLK